MSGTVSKIAAERNQKAIMQLAMTPGNDSCADCKTRNPRWASHNLGIFICMNCASVHRKIGTHITKVKSLTMDVWTREQVEHMRQVGNIKSNEIYNPDEVRHPPPANMIDLARDSEIEKFIRDKYEFKRFVNRTDRAAVVASHLGPSRSASSVRSSTSSSFPPSPTRNRTTLPPPKPSIPPATSAPAASTPTETMPPSTSTNTTMSRSVSQPVPPPAQTPAGGVWSDLASLQGPTQTSTLPLQYLSSTSYPSAPVPATNLTSNPAAGSTTLGTNFSMTSSSGPSVFPAGALVSGVASQPVQPSFVLGSGVVNPFAQMAAQQQQQQQSQQNHPPLAPSFGSSLPQQPSFTPQIQQPMFSRPVANPFFNAAMPPQGTLSPQPQAPFLSMTTSPVPFTSSPYQQPAQLPFQQQPTQTSFQPQPPQFGNGQPSGASVAGNPFTHWLTQPPNGAQVGQGSANRPWGSM